MTAQGVQVQSVPRAGRVSDAEFGEWMASRQSALMRTAYLLTGSQPAAEDLVQTALARLYLAWPRVRRSGTQAAYARRIVVNAHIDEVRRSRWRRERYVPVLPDRPGPAPPSALPDGIDGEAIRAALAALPPRMRAAIVLRH